MQSRDRRHTCCTDRSMGSSVPSCCGCWLTSTGRAPSVAWREWDRILPRQGTRVGDLHGADVRLLRQPQPGPVGRCVVVHRKNYKRAFKIRHASDVRPLAPLANIKSWHPAYQRTIAVSPLRGRMVCAVPRSLSRRCQSARHSARLRPAGLLPVPSSTWDATHTARTHRPN